MIGGPSYEPFFFAEYADTVAKRHTYWARTPYQNAVMFADRQYTVS
jgi:hypothetical protein